MVNVRQAAYILLLLIIINNYLHFFVTQNSISEALKSKLGKKEKATVVSQ